MSMHVVCLQMDIVFGDPAENRENVVQAFVRLFSGGNKVDVVVLPELWTTGYDLTRLDDIADKKGAETKALMARLASTYNTNIVAGSIAKKSGSNVTNTLYVFDRSGAVVHEYSKAHLFQLMDEHLYLTAGSQEGRFSIDGHPSAGFICYDIRFPEWIRTHTTKGAEIVFVVAEWPSPRLAHWRALLISRAIENQCYIVACNRAGDDPQNTFVGHSLIIDPWGEIVAEASEEPTILSATLDLQKVAAVRKQIPIFQDRRPDIY